MKKTGLNFSEALELLKDGKMVCRSGWNGKNMFIYLHTFDTYEPCVVMFTAQQKHQPGWLCSQNDMLATDWEEVEESVDTVTDGSGA